MLLLLQYSGDQSRPWIGAVAAAGCGTLAAPSFVCEKTVPEGRAVNAGLKAPENETGERLLGRTLSVGAHDAVDRQDDDTGALLDR